MLDHRSDVCQLQLKREGQKDTPVTMSREPNLNQSSISRVRSSEQ